MSKVAGWDNYNDIVNQVAQQRVQRLGPTKALALSQPGGAFPAPQISVPQQQGSERSGLYGSTATSLAHGWGSMWHGLLEGLNRTSSIIPDIGHEQSAISQQREHDKDLGKNTFTIGNLFKDYYHSITKGTNDALHKGDHRFFSDSIQEAADIAKANREAKANSEPRPVLPDVKPGSAYVNPYVKGWAGFAGDVVADPLNLVGVGTVPAAAKALEGGDAALAASRTARILAPAEKKQIALRLGTYKNGVKIPTGIPAVQVGKRMAESSSPKTQKLLESFRPLGNWINNPELRDTVLSGRATADALQHQFVHGPLAKDFAHLDSEGQKDLLARVVASKGHNAAGSIEEKAHQHIFDLSKLMHQHQLTSDMVNHHLWSNAFHLDTSVRKPVEELFSKAAEHKNGLSHFLGTYHDAIQKAIEHKAIVKEFPSQPLLRPLSRKMMSPEALAKAQSKYVAGLKASGYVNHSSPFLHDRLIHGSLVPQFQRAENLLRARGNKMGSNWYAKAIDKSNSVVKKVDVGLNPASSARRVLSFVNQQVINGHFNINSLKKALAVNVRHHELYRDVSGKLLAKDLGTAGKAIKIGKDIVPTAEVFAEGSKRGLFGNFTRLEVRNAQDVAGKGVVRKGGHKVLEKMFNANEHIDNTFRMATFLHALENAPKGLSREAAYDHAMREVRRTHLDFSQLTPFERKYMTRLMTFYAAISRSTPIAYRQLLANPGGVSKLPIAQRDFSRSFGADQQPGPIPKYLTDNGAGIAGMFKGQPVALDQKNDVTDAYEQFLGANPLKVLTGTASQSSPILKDPLEVLFNKSIFTGAPTRSKGSDIASYFASQTPFTGIGNRMVKERNAPGGKTDWNIDPTLLRLLGIGTNVVTPKQQKSAQKQANRNKKHPWYEWFKS